MVESVQQQQRAFRNITDSNVESVLRQYIEPYARRDNSLEEEKNEMQRNKNEGKMTEEEFKSFNLGFRKRRVDLNEEFKSALRIFLQAYSEKATVTKTLDIERVSGDFRKQIHDVCDEFGLDHKTSGSKVKRLHISKKKVQEPISLPPIIDIERDKPQELEVEDMIPDSVEKITVLEITEEFVKIDFPIPADNGFPILHYSVEIKNGRKFEHAGEPPILLPYEKDKINKFFIIPINEIGPAFDNETFRLNLKGFQKGRLLIAGDVSENQVPSVCVTKSTPNYSTSKDGRTILSSFVELNYFSGWVKSVSCKENVLLAMDNGKLAQWGITLSSKKEGVEEVYPEKEEELIEYINSDPFFLLDHQTPKTRIFVHSVACGRDFGLLTSVTGEVYSWGKNYLGQLGLGDNNTRTFPVKIKALESEFITEVSTCELHSLALTSNGSVYIWGYRQALIGEPIKDRYGKIVDFVNQGDNLKEPRKITDSIGSLKIRKISAGVSHNAVISTNGELFTWGDNEFGQLGFNLEENVLSCMIPRRVEQFLNYSVLDASCGGLHTLAIVRKKNSAKKPVSGESLNNAEALDMEIKNTTELWAWGAGDFYQTGHNDRANRITPSRIISKNISGYEFKSVSAGHSHSLALTSDGKLFAWGASENGALGIPSNLKKVKEPRLVDLGDLKPREAFALCELSALII